MLVDVLDQSTAVHSLPPPFRPHFDQEQWRQRQQDSERGAEAKEGRKPTGSVQLG